MRALLIAVLALAACEASAAETKPGLNALIAAETARWSGKAGVYVKHLGTGEEAGINAADHFDSASTIKLSIMATAYKLADDGKLDLNRRYEIKPADYRPGSGILKFKDPGLKVTIRDLITQMTITSDNTATDIMVGQVGGPAAVNAWLTQNGYRVVHLNMTDNEYFRRVYELADPKYKALSAEDVFALSTDNPAFTAPRAGLIKRVRDDVAAHHANDELRKRALDETTWHGIVSPAEIGRLLEGIERCTIAAKASCDEMKRILRAQQAGTRKIPQFLNVPVGHKTGEIQGVTNDAAIVYARSGPIVMVMYTMGYTGLAGEADDREANLARLIVEYFDGAAPPSR